MNVKNILTFSIGPVGVALVGFITVPVLTWYFSIADIGRLSVLQIFINVGILLFGFGLDQAFVREYCGWGDKKELFKNAVFPGFLGVLGILILCSVLPDLISVILFDVEDFVLSLLVALGLLASYGILFSSLIFRMQKKGWLYSFCQLGPKLLLLCVLGLYVLLGTEYGIKELVFAYVIPICVVFLISVVYLRHYWLALFKVKLNRELMKVMLSYSMPLVLGAVAYWGLTAIDKIFLKALSNYEELGLYAVAVNFAGAAIVVQSLFTTIWAPLVYEWDVKGLKVEKIENVVVAVSLVVVFVFAVVGGLSWIVDYFLSESYQRVKYILIACMGYPLFYTLSETTVVGITLSRKTKYMVIASVGAFVINCIGNYLLIPILGAEGAAVSTCFAFWCFLVLRTELSIVAWGQISRLLVYPVSLLCLIAAVFITLYGNQLDRYLQIAIWMFVVCFSLLYYRSELCRFFIFMRSKGFRFSTTDL